MLKPESSKHLARALLSFCLPLIKFLQFRFSGIQNTSVNIFPYCKPRTIKFFYPTESKQSRNFAASDYCNFYSPPVICTLMNRDIITSLQLARLLFGYTLINLCWDVVWFSCITFWPPNSLCTLSEPWFQTSLLYSLPACFFFSNSALYLSCRNKPDLFFVLRQTWETMTFDARFYRIKFGLHLPFHFQNVSLIPVAVVIGTITWLQNLFRCSDFLKISSCPM